ncbi:MAG: class I SAM-dependent methyltransferase [Chiayiivirga sp.]|nr:class I SAM-dependent methyltransferase [Chiayiivirga sp.]
MKQESWSDYWRLGEPTTLNFFRDGYTGELAAFWHRLVDALPQGAQVLDLATGNGAVAVAVLRRARALGRALEIEGVDVAQIDPATHAGKQPQLREELQAIRFHPGTPAERTGLPAASYHLVTSQYGIEYGDLDASVTEIARLLRRGGSFAAILHSTDSNVAQTATRIDALLGLLLDELDLAGLDASPARGPGRRARRGRPCAGAAGCRRGGAMGRTGARHRSRPRLCRARRADARNAARLPAALAGANERADRTGPEREAGHARSARNDVAQPAAAHGRAAHERAGACGAGAVSRPAARSGPGCPNRCSTSASGRSAKPWAMAWSPDGPTEAQLAGLNQTPGSGI